MNRTLVVCLLVSVLAGVSGATAALLADWSWIAAFLAYSGCGSITLVSTALLANMRRPAASAAFREAGRRPEPEPAYA